MVKGVYGMQKPDRQTGRQASRWTETDSTPLFSGHVLLSLSLKWNAETKNKLDKSCRPTAVTVTHKVP